MISPRPMRRSPITAKVRDALAAEARGFIGGVYGLDAHQDAALAAVPIVWKHGRRRRAGFYRPGSPDGRHPRHISITIPPGSTARWTTYKRVHARLTTPRGGLLVPIRLRLVLSLVHEYTHAIQDGVVGGRKRRFLEAEPTKNELAYVRLHAPELHAMLVPVESSGSLASRAAKHAVAQTQPPRQAAGLRRMVRTILRRRGGGR